jgi:hypothetical protein
LIKKGSGPQRKSFLFTDFLGFEKPWQAVGQAPWLLCKEAKQDEPRMETAYHRNPEGQEVATLERILD